METSNPTATQKLKCRGLTRARWIGCALASAPNEPLKNADAAAYKTPSTVLADMM